jgi:hypothetical protein
MKTVPFKGRDPVRSKTVINNNNIAQIYISNYLGCSILYQNENNITVKISKFLQITGINIKTPQVHQHPRLKTWKNDNN